MAKMLLRLLVLLVVFSAGILWGHYYGPPIRKGGVEAWSIGLYRGTSPLTLQPAEGVRNPIITARDVTDMSARFVADPFLMKRDATWYLFFEVMNRETEQGDLSVATSTDLKTWKYERKILDEPFHLSYPYVFQEAGQYYMIPEAGQSYAIRLYRAKNFPFEWEYQQPLIEGQWVDSSIIKYNDHWYLFTTNSRERDTTRLFHAAALTGPWTEHPKSPVVKGSRAYARSAGRVIYDGTRILRFAQDNEGDYGTKVWAFEIRGLTPETFEHVKAVEDPVLTGSNGDWQTERMHQLDAHQIGTNDWVASVDGLKTFWRVRLW